MYELFSVKCLLIQNKLVPKHYTVGIHLQVHATSTITCSVYHLQVVSLTSSPEVSLISSPEVVPLTSSR